MVSLSSGEGAPGREFTDPARSLDDLAALAKLRASLGVRVRSGLAGGTWMIDGESHWLVVPDLCALARARPAFGVGFFGHAHDHVDHRPILDLEQNLLSRAPTIRGLLAYHNVQFASGQWANLVIFAEEDDPGRVRSDPTHGEALALTANHYSSVRLHRLQFADGAIGEAPPSLESTLLIDFSDSPPWRAVRR